MKTAHEKELEEQEEKEKHASAKNPKETKEEHELRLKREEEEARAKRWKDGKVTDEDIAFERISLLKEAHQILVDHVTRLGGVGAPMGPLGDRFLAWLKRYGDMAVVAPVETAEEKKAREEAEKAAEKEEKKSEKDETNDKDDKPEPKPFKFAK